MNHLKKSWRGIVLGALVAFGALVAWGTRLVTAGAKTPAAISRSQASLVQAWDKSRPELVLQMGHSQAPEVMVFSADGSTLASAGYDNTIRLWDALSGDLQRTLQARDGVAALAFAPGHPSGVGSTLISGHSHGTAKLWDVRTGALRHVLSGHGSEVKSVAFAPDGRTVATGNENGAARLWDVASGKLRRTLSVKSGWVRVAFTPDAKLLTGGQDQLVRLWDTRTGTVLRVFEGHQGFVNDVAVSPDGASLASGVAAGGGQGDVRIWNLATGELKQTLKIANTRSLTFLPDSKSLAVADGALENSALELWDTTTGTRRAVLSSNSAVSALSPDGKTLARSDEYGEMLQLCDARSGKVRRTLVGRGETVTALTCTGKIIASGHTDDSVRLWDAATGKLQQTLFMDYEYDWRTSAVALSPNSKIVAASPGGTGAPGDVLLWDTHTGKQLRTLKGWANKDDQIHSLAFAADGSTLATGGHDGTIKLWDVRTGKLRHMIAAQQGSVLSVACAPEGKIAASGGDNFTPKLWDMRTGKLIRSLPSHSFNGTYDVAFSPDGKILATGGERLETRNRPHALPRDRDFRVGEIKLWDVRTSKLLRTLVGPARSVYSLAFAPDGKTLAGGSEDTTRLWNVATGRLQTTSRGTNLSPLAFAPDGNKLLSRDENGALRLWHVRQNRALLTLMILPSVPGADSVDWIAYTPDGYYDGSPGAARFIRWRVGSEVYPAAKFEKQFHRPDLVQKALHGG